MTEGEVEAFFALLPAGARAAARTVSAADPAQLWEDERAMLPAGDPQRAQEVAAGRAAARACLVALGLPEVAVPRRPDGSPAWPAPVRGSITHKDDLCLAVAARRTSVSALGIDLEESGPLPEVAWPLVLSAGERTRLVGSGGPLDPRSSRLALCAKEAVYKWRTSGALPPLTLPETEIDLRGDRLVAVGAEPLPSLRHLVGDSWTIVLAWSACPAGPTEDGGLLSTS